MDQTQKNKTLVGNEDIETFRKNAHQVIDFICDYYQNIEKYPVLSQVKPGNIYNQIPDAPPQDGEEWTNIMQDVEKIILPGVTHWQHPNFFAFFPANVSFPAILGDLMSTGLGVQGMLWITSPACTELETKMLDWLASMLDLPDKFYSHSKGGGVIQGSASEATLVCLCAARYKLLERLKQENPSKSEEELASKLVVYASDQTHSSVKKACMIAGIPSKKFKEIPSDELHRFDAKKLREEIEKDLKDGLYPCYVVATMGTTATTSIDPIEEIGRLCKEYDIWMHVDAAYAGSSCICPEYRWMMKGIEYCSSFNFNPHKWMLVNFDCSALWIDSRETLIRTLSVLPEYLKNKATESNAVIDYRDWQVPLGRRFRSLKLWFVLRNYGVKKIQEFIREHFRLAKLFDEWVQKDPNFEIVCPTNLALVLFRMKASNEQNKALLEDINESGKLYLTGTIVKETYILRFSIGTSTTQEHHVREAWEFIKERAAKILSQSN